MTSLTIDSDLQRCFGTRLRHVELDAGSRAGRILAREDAIAMALDESTILLSKWLEAAPDDFRRLVIAHEIAHVIQLSRHGTDPEQQLEAEAWEAARNAVRGVSITVRGAASRPLAAKAIIAMGGALDAAAMAHYSQFKAERQVAAGAIAVSSCKIVAPVTWDSVLDQIVAGMADNDDKSFVLCAHGNKDGMLMPLVTGSAFVANRTSLEFLMKPDATTTTLKAVGGKAPPTSAQTATLVAKMQNVRNLHIGFVEFRGCAMGADFKNLEVLREFLGCISVSAPDVKSSWAMVTPNVLTGPQFSKWISKTPGVQVSSYPAGRSGLKVDWGAHKVFFSVESSSVVPLWMQGHFFKNPPFAPSPGYEAWMGNFGLHGLHLTPVALPMDPAYAAHIKRVISTPKGLVKM